MRNGAVAVYYAKEGMQDINQVIISKGNYEAALNCAYKQSKTTHQGEEAAECCRLLTFITMKFIEGEPKEFLESLGDKFKTPLYSGMHHNGRVALFLPQKYLV